MPRIIAYTYDADTQCIPCTKAVYAGQPRLSLTEPMQDENGIPVDAIDSEGNTVHPVFSTEEWCDADSGGCSMICGTCYTIIRQHEPSEHGYCNCGDGCPEDECDSCYTYDADEDGSYEDSGCTCPDCTAADQYRGEVE